MSSLTPTTTLTEEEEEDNELRDLVVDTLNANGILGQMKAQLRANVFLALEDEKGFKKQKNANSHLQNYLKTTDGRLIVHMIREFLNFFGLKFTQSVFDPEVLGGAPESKFPLKNREQLIEGLGLSEVTNKQTPLLAEILRLSKVSMLKSETPTPTERSEDESSMPSSLDSTGGLQSNMDPIRAAANASPGASLSNSANSTPLQSLNVSSRGNGNLDGTFVVNKSGEKSKDSNTHQFQPPNKSPPSAAIKPFPKESNETKTPPTPSTSSNTIIKESSETKIPPPNPTNLSKPITKTNSNLKPISNLNSNSPLGNLPPLSLGGSAVGGKSDKKNVLAPLKKAQTFEKTAKILNEDPKQEPIGSIEKSKIVNSTKTDVKKSEKDEVDDDIEEEIEEFLNSSGISTTEEFTKDETASEEASLKADYVEKL